VEDASQVQLKSQASELQKVDRETNMSTPVLNVALPDLKIIENEGEMKNPKSIP